MLCTIHYSSLVYGRGVVLWCRYLNDVYSLEVLEGTSLQWECPVIEGPTPSPRESHSSITIGGKLLIYGGMNGKRLNDLWSLSVGMYLTELSAVCIQYSSIALLWYIALSPRFFGGGERERLAHVCAC